MTKQEGARRGNSITLGQQSSRSVQRGGAIGQPTASRTVYKVALTGDTPANASANPYERFWPPAINASGDVAFQADTFENGTTREEGIFFGEFLGFSYVTDAIALRNDIAPGIPNNRVYAGREVVAGGFPFGFSQPVINDASRVAYVASYRSSGTGESFSNHGIWFAGPNGALPPELISWVPADAPDDPADPEDDNLKNYYLSFVDNDSAAVDLNLHSHISLPLTNETLTWYAKLTNAGSGFPKRKNGGLFWGEDAAYSDIIREWETIGSATVRDEGAFNNVFNSGASAARLGGGHFAAFSAFEQTPGDTMIAVIEKDPSLGITGHLIVDTGFTAAPGAGAGVGFSNANFGPAVNAAGAVAFRAQTDDADKWGVWSATLSSGVYTLTNVAYEGDTPPGPLGTGAFVGFGDPALNANDLKVFLGRYEYDDGGGPAQRDGLYVADAANTVFLVREAGTVAPGLDGSTVIGNFTTEAGGEIDVFADPIVNTTDNIAFYSNLDITDPGLLANLSGTGLFDEEIEEAGVFVKDYYGTLRNVAAVGMTLGDLIPGGDDRVLIKIRFVVEASRLIETRTLERANSGHQDGQRTAITNTVTSVGPEETCRKMRIAFGGRFYDPATTEISEGVFVAMLDVCEPSGCTSCLCSTDPNCLEGGTLLASTGPDYTQDGVVNDDDLNWMMKAYGYKGGRFDMNGDGIVGEKDVAQLVEAWGPVKPLD